MGKYKDAERPGCLFAGWQSFMGYSDLSLCSRCRCQGDGLKGKALSSVNGTCVQLLRPKTLVSSSTLLFISHSNKSYFPHVENLSRTQPHLITSIATFLSEAMSSLLPMFTANGPPCFCPCQCLLHAAVRTTLVKC